MADAVKQPETTKTGFQLHPENINRKGRPSRGWAWNELIEDAVNELAKNQSGDELEIKRIIVKRLAKMAAEGDINAIREIINRMDGMPKQSTDITSGGKPIPILGNVCTDSSNTETTETK